MACSVYRFIARARKDLDQALHYISFTLENPSAANRLLSKVELSLRNILSFPNGFPVLDNGFVQDIRVHRVPINGYLLYYMVDPKNEVVVMRFLHEKMKFDVSMLWDDP